MPGAIVSKRREENNREKKIREIYTCTIASVPPTKDSGVTCPIIIPCVAPKKGNRVLNITNVSSLYKFLFIYENITICYFF